jgi:hypothetical protein
MLPVLFIAIVEKNKSESKRAKEQKSKRAKEQKSKKAKKQKSKFLLEKSGSEKVYGSRGTLGNFKF